ncbi:MAG: 50S ribosomal protein L10 [Clostridiales bacterium]|jgi:large subunit ribosomal protein L10|nr:50S ribosomal protein L10 [Clostridiales bacterium]
MANIRNIELKAQKVAEVSEKLQKARSVVLFDYRGLTVSEVTNLRNEMRNAGVEYVVHKNGIVRRAAAAAGIDEAVNGYLKGPNAFAFGYEDMIVPAKILKDFIKKTRKCEIKGGIVEGKVESAEFINALADMPSRETLIARLLGSMMSPISGLAIALDRIADKLEQEGPAAAAAAPATAAEQPVEAAEQPAE